MSNTTHLTSGNDSVTVIQGETVHTVVAVTTVHDPDKGQDVKVITTTHIKSK